jgi:Ran-binding protein 1
MADKGPEPATNPAANPFASLGGANGQATAFGGGFSFGVPVAAFGAAPVAKEAEDEGEGDEEGGAAEEECQAEFKPLVQLEEVETSTGEEDEDCLFECKTKLYRFDGDSGEWKERGIGQARLLQHKENKKVRMLMRQEKTLKIRANHLVMPGTSLQPHAGSDKAWVWSAVDFSEGEQKVELFCLRFGSVEKAQDFSKKFEEAMTINAALLGTVESVSATNAESDKAADELASGLEKVAVAE